MKLHALVILLGALLVVPSGCAKPARRTAAAILKEREQLPRLFLTENTKKQVTAPGDKPMMVDPATRNYAGRPTSAPNPDCPGRHNDQPYLFIHPLDLGYFVQADGSIGFDEAKSKTTPPYHGCPECLKIRQLGKETPEVQARYQLFDKLQELPATATRRAQLDEELKKAMSTEPEQK